MRKITVAQSNHMIGDIAGNVAKMIAAARDAAAAQPDLQADPQAASVEFPTLLGPTASTARANSVRHAPSKGHARTTRHADDELEREGA